MTSYVLTVHLAVPTNLLNGTVKNANYAWILHMISKLSQNGVAGFVLANSSIPPPSQCASGFSTVTRRLIQNGVFVIARVRLCLLMLARWVSLLIGYIGSCLTRKIGEIGRTYHAWRGEKKDGAYEDKAGFCKSATLEEIKSYQYVLTPGRYVGAEAVEDDGIPFKEKMTKLSAILYEQMRKGTELDVMIRKNLEVLGYGE